MNVWDGGATFVLETENLPIVPGALCHDGPRMPASQESAGKNKRNTAAVLFSMQQLWRGKQWQEDADAAGRDLLPVICRCPW